MNLSRTRAAAAALLLSLTVLITGLAVAPAPASASGAAPRLLVYGPGTPSHDTGVTITRALGAFHRLPGAPLDFQRFVARQVRRLHTGACPSESIGVTVNRVRTDGFARGAVSACGGYVALWKRVGGRWTEVVGTQDVWTCRELRRNAVPASVVGPDARCARGREVVTYHHR